VSNSVVATVVSAGAEEQATSALMQNAKSATIKARYFIKKFGKWVPQPLETLRGKRVGG
jgi:hypothetical protein